MRRGKLLVLIRLSTTLRIHELQFVRGCQGEQRVRLRADADPIDGSRQRAGSVRFNCDPKAACTQCREQGLIDLKKRLATRQHRSPAALPERPLRQGGIGQCIRRCVTHPTTEIGITELADGISPVLLSTGPKVATGEPDKHASLPEIYTLTLLCEENFSYGIAHSPGSDILRLLMAGACSPDPAICQAIGYGLAGAVSPWCRSLVGYPVGSASFIPSGMPCSAFSTCSGSTP